MCGSQNFESTSDRGFRPKISVRNNMTFWIRSQNPSTIYPSNTMFLLILSAAFCMITKLTQYKSSAVSMWIQNILHICIHNWMCPQSTHLWSQYANWWDGGRLFSYRKYFLPYMLIVVLIYYQKCCLSGNIQDTYISHIGRILYIRIDAAAAFDVKN